MTATVHRANRSRRHTWRLYGAVSGHEIDCYFDVVGFYGWERHKDAFRYQDLCTGALNLITSGLGLVEKRFARPTLRLQGSGRSAVKTDLETAWAYVGPWSLATPSETLSVQIDASQGNLAWQSQGWFQTVTIAFVEV